MRARDLRWLRTFGLIGALWAPLVAQAEEVPVLAKGAAMGKTEVVARVPIGKWPEGVAVNGRTAWVAISGERKLTAVNLDTATVGQDLNSGRLPVQMASVGDTVYAITHTDRKLWAVKGEPGKAVGKTIHVMPDCPNDMVTADGQAWVLLWTGCSSADAQVVRASLNTKAMVTSKKLGKGAWAVAMGHGHVWVMHTDGAVGLLDPRTLAPMASVPAGDGHMRLTVGPQGVYASGRTGQVTRIDPATRAVSGTVDLGERIVAIWADADGVVALQNGGALFRLDPVSLATLGQYTSPAPGLEGKTLVRDGDRWLVTQHAGIDGADTTGTLWVLKVPALAP